MIIKQKWIFLFFASLIIVIVAVSVFYKTNSQTCSSSGVNWEVMVSALSEHSKKQGPDYDLGPADIERHFAENCEADLKIYNDYLDEHK
jgi:hypothetical protein